ncbi:MAG: hypothetical protein GWN58_52025, partial [Anaerolineae bacterium]|nr:hypothetical protein [Anaerolineae bacterium]
MTDASEFNWLRYPAAETFIAERLDEVLATMPAVRAFSRTLFTHTGS